MQANAKKADIFDISSKRHFIFMLLNNFSMLSFTSAVETLRVANRILDKDHYKWTILSKDGASVISSASCEFNVSGDLDSQKIDQNDVVLLCGGLDIQNNIDQKLLTWLRRISRRGTIVGGLCTAGYVLAVAELLDGKKATIHWENQDSFTESFANIQLTKSVFTIDRGVITAAGGVATIDLILNIIAQSHGNQIASQVADGLIYNTIRTDQDSQRLSIPVRIGVRHPKLNLVVKMMEQTLENPVSPALFAEKVRLSSRQLERLFQRYLNRSPKRYYMELRLQKARGLLLQTDMSIINISLACGFSSPSHFSKCYRKHYTTTPYRERGTRSGFLSR